jgi:hypothetical protein
MREGEWHLGFSAYDNYPGASLTFGREDSGIYCLSEPDIAFGDIDGSDAAMPGEDGVRMGRDYQRSATVSLELGVDGSRTLIDRHWPRRPWGRGERIGDWTDMEAALANLFKDAKSAHERGLDGVNLLRQVWRADGIRVKAGRVAWLSHTFGGRTRQLYGRPRKIAVAHSRLARQGYTPVVAEFVAVDDRFYDSTEQEAELYDHRAKGDLPSRPGRPLPDWLYTSKKTVSFKQVGTLNTYPYIEIYGPCKNPKITVSNLWAVQLATTISAGDRVVIDPRPWMRTVTYYDGATSRGSVADKLTRASPMLKEMFFPPGYWTATLAYTKTSATQEGPTVRIAWRDAFSWW